jgi:NDP-sugar pyrophosphorylase family protein
LKGILIVNLLQPEIEGRGPQAPRRFPPLVDRPFLQHVVESVITAGVTELDVISGRGAGVVRHALGDGNRWGCQLRHHETLDANPGHTMRTFRAGSDTDNDERILLAHSDFLPQVGREDLTGRSSAFFCWRGRGLEWTGWALLRQADLCRFIVAEGPAEFFALRCLQIDPGPEIVEVARPLSVRSYSDLIEAQGRVLSRQHTGLLITGREVAPNIWIARNAAIHRTARLVAPVYLGENCRVAAGTQIGPAAAIGRDCLIDRQTLVADSVVCAGSYVGEGLELRNAFIDGSRLVNARLRAEIENVDPVLLGSLYGGRRSRSEAAWTL